MTSIMEASDGGDIKEGLLCPICMQDLGTVVQLEQHFETVHSSEDKAILNSLKGLFGKAKRKILRKDSQGGDELDENLPFRGAVDSSESDYSIDALNWEPQEPGFSVSHTEKFRQIRSSRIDSYVVETNKLLIRLDKLITNVPSDPRKRKAYEQSVVPWVNDGDVKLCPTCARSFSIARRRHHCRLCGGVMCMACSEFIEFSYAGKLTNPAFNSKQLSQQSSSAPASPLNLFPLRRSGSNNSLASMINVSSGEEHIRVCKDCKKLLQRRDQQIEQRTNKPTIVLFYEKLKAAIEESKRLVPVYCKLSDSLNQGETNYHLKDAQDLRIKLTKLAETMDLYSKKILMLGVKDDPPPHPKSIQLQKMVRQSATIFLQERMVGLPRLPSAEELQKLQEARRLVLHKQIQQEKQVALLAQQQVTSQPRSSKGTKSEATSVSPNKAESSQNRAADESQVVDIDEGWVSQSVGPSSKIATQDDDPMVQQMDNIRSFIRQAREAHKYDEVELLEANLKLLKQEYLRQQNEKENNSNT